MKSTLPTQVSAYQPTEKQQDTSREVLNDYILGRSILQKSYNQFNGRQLYECIDDWTKRWNGYIPPQNPLLDEWQSRIFLNFTRNQIITYLAKVALTRPKAKIKAVNKKTSMFDQRMSEVCEDLIQYSADAENGDARFLEAALEVVTKGTVVVYEGYKKQTQEELVPESVDAETGKVISKKTSRILFDNCYQDIVPIEDFYIANPYEPDVQKQPFVIWRQITTYTEGQAVFEHYPGWQYVQPGMYVLTGDVSTFYRNQLQSDLQAQQIEILRYYHRMKNRHVLMINGIVMYDGPIPFKDGRYPFGKTVYEPFGNDFFWGMSFAQKIMGDQDLINTLWNMMVDKTEGSLLPYGLSSDLDDLIEDDRLEVGKIRKVGDINKWKFDTMPAVNSSEQAMIQMAMNFAREFSGDVGGGGSALTPRGGALAVRQVLLKQQESMNRLGFSMSFLEDFERDRTELRLNHILQFYSIPKIEKITGVDGQEVQQLMFRDIKLSNVSLGGGETGQKIIKLVGNGEIQNPDQRQGLADNLALTEAMGEQMGTPTQALALSVDTFYDYNYSVVIVKNSSFEKNATLDQASRQEYANWRLSLAQVAPVDAPALVKWVDQAYDIDSEMFTPKQPLQQPPGVPVGVPGQPGALSPASELAPSSLGTLSNAVG